MMKSGSKKLFRIKWSRRLPRLSNIAMHGGFFMLILLSAFSSLPLDNALASSPTAEVHLVHSRDKYPAGGTYPVFFDIAIEKGWKIHGFKESDEGLIPSRLSLESMSDLNVLGPSFPEPEKVRFDYTSEEIEVFSGLVTALAWLQIDEHHLPGNVVLAGQFSYQACSNTVCRRPETVSFRFPFDVVAADASVQSINQERFVDVLPVDSGQSNATNKWAAAGLWMTLLGIFVGGLALNLTPCIYPLIPITVSYFGGRSGRVKGIAAVHGILYLAGLSVTNSILGVIAAFSGGMLGAVLQTPAILVVIAAIMLALALSFFGVWELRLPQSVTQVASKNFKGYFGTFFMGLTLGIVAAPCLGPFILGLLTYVGQTGDPFVGFLYFFVLSIGMGLPLCILAIFSGGLDRLPKSGDWMIWIRKLMGWVLIAVAAYIVRPIIPPSFFKDALVFIVMIVAGIHLGWIDKTGIAVKRFKFIKKVTGALIGILGVVLLYSAMQSKTAVSWAPYDHDSPVAAQAAGRPVILDFYAEWCLPCKELDHYVFTDPRVLQLSQRFTALRMDLTRRQTFQDEVLRYYNVRGVPTVIFLDANGLEIPDTRVGSFIDAQAFLERMNKALNAASQ